MTSQNDVEQFLKKFKVKLKIFNVVYIGREKNAQTLLEMELVPATRTEILKNLKAEDYCEGPLDQTIHGAGNMWVFGKEIKRNQIYIKVAMGKPNNSVICISFHPAEHVLKYPFKEL